MHFRRKLLWRIPRGDTVIGESHAVRIEAFAPGAQHTDDLARQVEIAEPVSLCAGRAQLLLLCYIDASPNKSRPNRSPERRRSERTESSHQVARCAWEIESG